MLKKWTGLLLVLVMILAVVGCGNDGGTGKPEIGGEEIAEHHWQLGHILTGAPDDNYQVFCTYFADNVKEMSDGKMTIEVVPNAQLGGERDMVEGMQIGTIDMAMLTNVNMGTFVPKLLANDLPFIYSDQKMAWEILDGDLGREMLDALEDVGIKGLAWGEGGFRHLITSKKVVSTPADIKGLKIRSLENDLYIKTYQALGTNPTPMAWTETFTAVQQGTIDGLDIPIGVIYSNGFYKIAPDISMTGHFYSPLFMAVSLNVWEGLNEKEQEVLMQAAVKAGQDERQFNVEMEETFMDEMIAEGTNINKDVDFAAFQEALIPLYDEYGERIGKDFLDRLLKATSEIAAE